MKNGCTKKSTVILSIVITFVTTLIIVASLAYLFLPRLSDNELLPITIEKMNKHNVSVVPGRRIVNQNAIEMALLQNKNETNEFHIKYQHLVNKDGFFLILTNEEVLELINSFGEEQDIEAKWSEIEEKKVTIESFSASSFVFHLG